jgi:hypothetical protein
MVFVTQKKHLLVLSFLYSSAQSNQAVNAKELMCETISEASRFIQILNRSSSMEVSA